MKVIYPENESNLPGKWKKSTCFLENESNLPGKLK